MHGLICAHHLLHRGVAESGWISLVNGWSTFVVAVATVALAAFGALQIRLADRVRRERREADLTRLWARATYLRRQLARLPTHLNVGQAPPAVEWRAEDERLLEAAAAEIGASTMIETADVARHLEAFRQAPPTDGPAWGSAKRVIDEGLQRLEATGAERRIKPTTTKT
jgi:hypothetical protein